MNREERQRLDLEGRLAVRFADGTEVVAGRAGSQSLREMVR